MQRVAFFQGAAKAAEGPIGLGKIHDLVQKYIPLKAYSKLKLLSLYQIPESRQRGACRNTGGKTTWAAFKYKGGPAAAAYPDRRSGIQLGLLDARLGTQGKSGLVAELEWFVDGTEYFELCSSGTRWNKAPVELSPKRPIMNQSIHNR